MRLLAVFNITELTLLRRRVGELAATNDEDDNQTLRDIRALRELISDEQLRQSEAVDNGDDDHQALRDIETLRELIDDELLRFRRYSRTTTNWTSSSYPSWR